MIDCRQSHLLFTGRFTVSVGYSSTHNLHTQSTADEHTGHIVSPFDGIITKGGPHSFFAVHMHSITNSEEKPSINLSGLFLQSTEALVLSHLLSHCISTSLQKPGEVMKREKK